MVQSAVLGRMYLYLSISALFYKVLPVYCKSFNILGETTFILNGMFPTMSICIFTQSGGTLKKKITFAHFLPHVE